MSRGRGHAMGGWQEMSLGWGGQGWNVSRALEGLMQRWKALDQAVISA